MRVLQVISGLAPRLGGPAISVLAVAKALERAGVESAIFSTDNVEPAGRGSGRLDVGDLSVGPVDVELFRIRPPRRWAYAPDLDRALRYRVREFDVVHIHSLFLYPNWAAARAAQRARVPYVIAPCGTLDRWMRRRNASVKKINDLLWQRRALDRAALLHFKTADEARQAEDHGLIPRGYVVPNGLELDAYSMLPPRSLFREKYLGGFEGIVVLNIGRISAIKGMDKLIDAASLLKESGIDVRVVIAGPDDESLAAPLHARAKLRGVQAHFVGMLGLDGKRAALAAADIWALPSRSENFGQAVLEALAAGVPCVISSAVGLASDVHRAGAAMVVEPTAQSFADAMLELLRDSRLTAALRESGPLFAARYDIDAVARELRSLYRMAVIEAGV